MSGAWLEPLRSYVGSRLPPRLYLPCVVLLAAAGLAGGREPNPGDLLLTGVLAWTLLLQFRLWDDLCDREADRRAHPHRVLVRASSLAPFHALLILSFLLNLALVAVLPGFLNLGLFLALNGAAALWYAWGRRVLPNVTLGYHLVLLKYPVFVLLLSQPARNGRGAALAMALVYLCFAIHEAIHDPRLADVPGVRFVLTAEVLGVFLVGECLALDLAGRSLSLAALEALLGLAVFPLMAEQLLTRRPAARDGRKGLLVFVLGFALILNFTLGVGP